MPTGLFRQVLYRSDNKTNKIPDFITIAVLCATAAAMVVVNLPFFKSLSVKPAYFLRPELYFYGLLVLWIADFVCSLNAKLKKYCAPLNFLLVLVLGYLISEMVYRYSPPMLPAYFFQLAGAKGGAHLSAFFMHRVLQIFPLVLMVSLILIYGGRFPGYLRFGDLSVKTDILNRSNPQSWSAVLLRFGIYLFSVLGILTILSRKTASTGGIDTALILPILLYALWNCFVEETIFRGVLLPVFGETFGDTYGNLVQAVLFGIIHISPVSIATSVLRMVIFTFLGWFFGKAVKQTGGIGTSWVMHVLIIIAIELRIMIASL
ncbi:MAG: CPBP family intramembrane metalloprotease [Firmicutes bacterium]|nr:CPBP family intramembrane metalloprotease [Bacillota bacterium]